TIPADICLIYRPEMASLPILDSLRDLLKQQIKTI
ncbi:MAG TPA: LysR family transcriptional regulator, partial [Shewanella sp.]|nr:LysR family transcriptional regulator [Shewanella sp.]